MNLPEAMRALAAADLAALGWLVLAWFVIGHLVERPPASRPSVAALMTAYRREWMRTMVTREPRIFDANIIDSLRQGTSFFASACMIAIGGGIALIGNAERLSGLAQELNLGDSPTLIWEIRLILVILFVTQAFLNFVWAHRLFGYCSIVMAAVPNDADDATAYDRAAQAAEINISAAKNFNRGLRSVYFALGAMGWLFGPAALAVTATVTVLVIAQREFWSHSREVLLRNTPK